MEQKELAIVELYTRCASDLYDAGLVVTLERRPGDPLASKDNCPAVLMWEGNDVIDERSSGEPLGYPARRIAELIVEVWGLERAQLVALNNATRAAVLGETGLLVSGDVSIREARAVGPLNHPIPGVEGYRIFFELRYNDAGPDFSSASDVPVDPATGKPYV